MKHSPIQKLASIYNCPDKKTYIINKREKGQKRFFVCGCCGQKHDLKNSIDYVGAIQEWEARGGKCYACGNGFCHCKEDGTLWGK